MEKPLLPLSNGKFQLEIGSGPSLHFSREFSL
jgi:hypothetical protein